MIAVRSNPYLDEWQRLLWSDNLRKSSFESRADHVRRYAWAIPNDEALDAMASYSPLIEVGAGAGYWAHLLAARGVDIIAFDKIPVGIPGNNWLDCNTPEWFDVHPGRTGPLMQKRYSDRTLFLCWPPYEESFADEALRSYGGDWFLYIGEEEDGATGSRSFFDRLRDDWDLDRVVSIPQWPGIHDALFVYQRKPEVLP